MRQPKDNPALLLAFLQGCQHGSTPSVDSVLPAKPHIDASVMQECEEMVEVPHRFIPYDEAIGLWTEERRRSGDCRR